MNAKLQQITQNNQKQKSTSTVLEFLLLKIKIQLK